MSINHSARTGDIGIVSWVSLTRRYVVCSHSNEYTQHTITVKVSDSLTAVGAVGVRVPLYLGHS